MSMDTMQTAGQYRQHIPTSASYSSPGNSHYDDQDDMDPEGYYISQSVSVPTVTP